MWMVLLYATPLTGGIALGAMVLGALLLARWRRPDPDGFRTPARTVLGVASVAYLAVLCMPAGDLVAAGESGRPVSWNPFRFVQEERWDSEDAADPSFGQFLEDGTSAYYGGHELTPEQVEEERRSPEQPGGSERYEYFVHPTTDGDLVLFDARGEDLDAATEAVVRAGMAEGIRWAHEPRESAALVYEEKVVNLLLFVPVGAVAFAAFSSWAPRLLFGPALSLAVEAAQWALAVGAVDTADLMVNSLGAVLGVLLAGGAVALLSVRPARSAREDGDGRPDPDREDREPVTR